MLEKIRKAGHHFLFKLLFLLIAIVFAVGLLDFSNPNSNVLITIGKHKISLDEFLESKEEMLSELNIDKSQIKGQQDLIDMNVMMQLITESLIKQETEALGIKIDPEVVVEYIKNYNAFKKNGEFDLETYKKALEFNSLTEEQLLEKTSEKVASRFLFDSLVVNVPLKNILSGYLKDYLTEKREISLITIDSSKASAKNIKDEDLSNYYQQNTESFYTKEYRSFDYLLINQDELEKNIKINQADLEKEYQENKEDYVASATRDFYHFLSPNQETANQVMVALKENQDTSQVAKNFVPQNVIGEIFTNQTDQSFLFTVDPSIFQLGENDVTIPVKSDLGWHVFKVLKIHPKQYKNYAEAKDDVKNNLIYKMRETALNDLLGLVEEDVSSGANFEDIATRTHVHLNKIDKVSEDNTYAIIDKDNNPKLDPGILELVFQMEEQEESAITMLSDEKTYVLVRIHEIVPSRIQSFDEAKELVKSQYLEQLKNKIAQEIAQILKTKLMEEKQNLLLVRKNQYALNNQEIEVSLKEICTKYGFDVQEINIKLNNEEINRPELKQNNISDSFVNQLFELELNQISNPEQLDYAKYAIARVNQSIKMSHDKIDPQIYKRIEKISEDNYKNEIYDLYMNYLRNKYIVEINRTPLNEYYIE